MIGRLVSLLISPTYFRLTFLCFGWLAIQVLEGYASGWLELSRRFRRHREPFGSARSVGPTLYAAFLRCWSDYSSVLRITAAEDALYLSSMFYFRLCHPPLRIPWSEVQLSVCKRRFSSYVVLTLGCNERIPLRISPGTADRLNILKQVPGAGKLWVEPNFDILSESFVASQKKKRD